MSSFIHWEKTKRQVNRDRYAFKFRMDRARYGNFIINHFYFIIAKAKMRIVKITGADGSFSGIKYVANSFGILAYHYHLTLHCIGVLCKPFLRFKIIPDRITLKFVITLCKMRPGDKFTGAINTFYSSKNICFLVQLHFWGCKIDILVMHLRFSIKNNLLVFYKY